MKRLLTVFAAAIILAAVTAGAAAEAKPNKEFKLPKGAIPLADGSYYLGKKTDPTTGKEVDGIAFLHPKKQAVKQQAAKPGGRTACYAFIASGLKWKTVEPWLLDGANTQGLTDSYLLSNTSANIAKWETAAGADIFGEGSLASGLSADTVQPDGQNEVLFGSIESDGTIAVTIVWGYYNGPAKFREIIEWDQVYDQEDFAWSSTGQASKMDFENISTHEVGHAAGMGHPSASCTEETMYAYATEGETKKRTLNPGDTAGINALY